MDEFLDDKNLFSLKAIKLLWAMSSLRKSLIGTKTLDIALKYV